MGVPARAAVEAPEGGRARYGAQPRLGINKRRRVLMSRGMWLTCAFRRFASLLLPEANLFSCVVVARARAPRRRENDFSRRHCRARGAQRRLHRQSMRTCGACSFR